MKKINQVKFQPVEVEADELINAIRMDPERQGDRWDLRDPVDVGAIQRFWDDALKENEGEAA